jgi:hypothetical protein
MKAAAAKDPSKELEVLEDGMIREIARFHMLMCSLIAWIQGQQDDAGALRELWRFNAEGGAIVADVEAGRTTPVIEGVIRGDFTSRVLAQRLEALERILGGEKPAAKLDVSKDNEKGLMICDRLIGAAGLSAKETEFIGSLRRQILADPRSFELSAKQGKWLWDIWCREGGRAHE